MSFHLDEYAKLLSRTQRRAAIVIVWNLLPPSDRADFLEEVGVVGDRPRKAAS